MFKLEPMSTSKQSFGFLGLLISLLLLLLLPGLFGSHSGGIIPMLFALVLVASLYLVATERKNFVIGLMLALPVLLTHWPLGLLSEPARLTMNSAFQIVFLAYVCAQIFSYLFRAQKIEVDVIYAALCLYLLIAVIWAFGYFLVEFSSPGAISMGDGVDMASMGARDLMAQTIYFSFVTITTLGYGDMTPVSRLAQSLTIIEALVGQIYIAIVIARLVAMQIAEKLRA